MQKNKLCFGDNLEVMRELESSSVDLIATDPPFNSGRDYNIFLEDSKAQKKAFTDIWVWNQEAIDMRKQISFLAKENKSYYNLEQALLGYDILLQKAIKGPNAKLRSYLTFMGPRLVEMHRLLKDTGSLYLHCDPNASHYLKGLLDTVFGNDNFKNEIVWGYANGGRVGKGFKKQHDIIFYYLKNSKKDYTFNKEVAQVPLAEASLIKDTVKFKKSDKIWVRKKYSKDMTDVWNIIFPTSARERLGYPTQKPVKVYEYIVGISSNKNDIVLDPFCGCGTTLDAAQTLNRNWLGIDLTVLSLEPIQTRLLENHNLQSGIDYEIIGYPTNMQEVMKLVKNEKKHNDFANWAVTRLGLQPTKDSNDGGFDGAAYTRKWIPKGMKNLEATVLAEVKTGSISKQAVRAFCQSMNDQNATAGIMISFHKPTTAMREYQERLGAFEHNNRSYDRLQFWCIDDDYFKDPESINQQIKLPWFLKKVTKSGTTIPELQLHLL